jgi:hypothetical protein
VKRALVEVWTAFVLAFRAGVKMHRTESAQPDVDAVGEEVGAALKRHDAEDQLRQAMKRYGLTERDRDRQAGRES